MTIEDTQINQYLDQIGVKHANLGYKFLISAIRMKSEHGNNIGYIEIYKSIAQEYGIPTYANVERSIRYTVTPFGMTNKEFIARAADDIVYGYESQNR